VLRRTLPFILSGAVSLAFLLVFLLAFTTAAWADACGTGAPNRSVTSVQRHITGGGPGHDGTQTVELPDQLPLALRNERVHISYTIDVSACASEPAAALWLFRLGSPYRISVAGKPLVMLNPRALLSPELAANPLSLTLPGIHNGRIPALFALPPGAKTVLVELQTQPYLPSGIVRAQLGPTNLLLPVQAEAAEVVVAYMEAAAGVLLVLSLLAWLLWLPRRTDRSLLWLAVAVGLWGMRGVVYFGHKVYVNALLFEQFNSLNVLLACSALTAAMLHLLGGIRPAERRALQLALASCLAAFVLATWANQGASLVRAMCLLGSFVMVCWLVVRVWAGRAANVRWYTAVLLAGLAGLLWVAVHDLMLLGGALAPDEPSYLFWGFVIMLTSFASMSGHYIVLTLNRAERSNEELEQHVARKSVELQQSYALLRDAEQDTVRTQERERLLRDMHDGLGAQLITALRGVERGALAPQQVVQSLQDSLDELRLLMDSTDLNPYLPGALAAWRNRWDARLAAAGVALDWHIDDSLDNVQLGSDVAMQVMRILQEAATNVVKHSQARHMTLTAKIVQQAPGLPVLCIEIVDDGVGPQPEPVRAGARGLKNMHYRAGQIGAQLQVGPRDLPQTGCRVALSLPVA
jgi:signal transduction histidine kinase